MDKTELVDELGTAYLTEQGYMVQTDEMDGKL